MLSFYYKRETGVQQAHTIVRFDEVYLGYYIKNKSQAAKIDENWNFVSKSHHLKSFPAKTRVQLIDRIKTQLKIT